MYSFDCRGSFASKPQVVCDSYPERIVVEAWESTDSSGIIQAFYGRNTKLDGTLLAMANRGEWTDIASGETWSATPLGGRDLIQYVEGMFMKIEREYARDLNGVDSEYLGRPSVVFPAGEFEYQVANSLLQRQTRWQKRDDGTRQMISEIKVVDFAMLPPGSFPDFATSSGE